MLRCHVSVCVLLSSCGAVGLPTAFPCGHRCTVGIDRDSPMCLDAQGGIQAKRQPFVAGVVLYSCVLNVIGQMCSCTFCQMLDLRILTHLLDWKRCSQSSQSSPFVPSRIRGSLFLSSDCVLNPANVSCRDLECCAPRGSCCASPLYKSCATWQV